MIRKLTPEGEHLPRGYGVAWYNLYTNRAVCYPVPLNKLAGLLRRCWHWAQASASHTVLDNAYLTGYHDGYDKGYIVGESHAYLRAARILARDNPMEYDRLARAIMRPAPDAPASKPAPTPDAVRPPTE